MSKQVQGPIEDMTENVTDISDTEQLVAEISRLRGQVAQLQERVEQLDQLAHQDSLVSLPNRRGFMAEMITLGGTGFFRIAVGRAIMARACV